MRRQALQHAEARGQVGQQRGAIAPRLITRVRRNQVANFLHSFRHAAQDSTLVLTHSPALPATVPYFGTACS
jgi:hypothetical protein